MILVSVVLFVLPSCVRFFIRHIISVAETALLNDIKHSFSFEAA